MISRGLERRAIFRDDADRRDFLERLFALTQSLGVRVHAGRFWLGKAMQSRRSGQGVLLGSQEWTAKMRRLLDGDEREHPALQAARREAIGFETVVEAVVEEFGEPWEELRVRHGHPARALAIVLCPRHTSLTLSEIGARLGGSDYAAVSQAQKRMEKKLLHDPHLAVIARRIAKHLQKLNVET